MTAVLIRRKLRQMQALEDAIRFRRARAGQACRACGGAGESRCEDHGRDIDLISEYEIALRQLSEAVEGCS
jgi:hypothetical protein